MRQQLVSADVGRGTKTINGTRSVDQRRRPCGRRGFGTAWQGGGVARQGVPRRGKNGPGGAQLGLNRQQALPHLVGHRNHRVLQLQLAHQLPLDPNAITL